MINQCTASCSYMYSESMIQEGKTVCETIPDSGLDISQIIEEKKASLSDEDGAVYCYKEWLLKTCKEFTSAADHLVNSFAHSLIKLNCGSIHEKRLFLRIVSKNIDLQLFSPIKGEFVSFIKDKIQEQVAYYADEKMKNMTNAGDENYTDLGKFILEKSEEVIRERYDILELTSSIPDKISSFCEPGYIKKGGTIYANYLVERELKEYIDVEKTPFTAFMELYRDYLEENYHYIMSKSIEIFNSVMQDKECLMSFAFCTILGHMVYHRDARKLDSIVRNVVSSTIKENNIIDTIITNPYHTELERFFLDSEKRMKEKVERFLLENKVVVLNRNTIATCNKEIMEKMVHFSIKHLKFKIRLHLSMDSGYLALIASQNPSLMHTINTLQHRIGFGENFSK